MVCYYCCHQASVCKVLLALLVFSNSDGGHRSSQSKLYTTEAFLHLKLTLPLTISALGSACTCKPVLKGLDLPFQANSKKQHLLAQVLDGS